MRIVVEGQPTESRHRVEIGLAVPQRLLPGVVVEGQFLPGERGRDGAAAVGREIAVTEIEESYAAYVRDRSADQLAAVVTDAATSKGQMLQGPGPREADAKHRDAIRREGDAIELQVREAVRVPHALADALREPLQQVTRQDYRDLGRRSRLVLGVCLVQWFATLIPVMGGREGGKASGNEIGFSSNFREATTLTLANFNFNVYTCIRVYTRVYE